MGLKLMVATLVASILVGTPYENIDLTNNIEVKEVIQQTLSEQYNTIIKDELIKEELEIVYFDVNGLSLNEGKVSENVLRLKTFLTLEGYTGLDLNYYFDTATKNAVKEYQKSSGLVVDGSVGKNTFTKINSDLKENQMIIPEISIDFSKEIPENVWLVINKSSNTLYHLKGKDVIMKYPVATGKNASYTPEGQFSIVVKSVNPSWGGLGGKYKPIKGGASNNPLGKRWLGLSVGGGGKYGIHGNAAPGSIGTYASLGCIRMNNSDVEYLYDLLPKGTNVWIGREEKLKELGLTFK